MGHFLSALLLPDHLLRHLDYHRIKESSTVSRRSQASWTLVWNWLVDTGRKKFSRKSSFSSVHWVGG